MSIVYKYYHQYHNQKRFRNSTKTIKNNGVMKVSEKESGEDILALDTPSPPRHLVPLLKLYP